MAARNPARFLAPLALIAVIGALYIVVKPHSDSGGSATPTSTTQPAKKPPKKHHKKKPKTYTVQPGDTPSGIAQKAGISLDKLEQLNPSLDPQALAPGEKLKIK